jgi:hypothetical protein
MKKPYLTFLLLVTILLAIETGFLVFMVKFAHVNHHPKFVLVIALVYLLLIPSNIFVSWKMALAGKATP